jgi:4-hydroxy-tetrahydrodipicolinate synthase
MFKGSFVALITPLRNGQVDEPAFRKFVAWQVREGTDGLVPCGTTGESPTLSHEEHEAVIEMCVAAARGRVPVMAGTGSNSTEEAISLTRHAERVGCDAALVVTPYYNKPTQEGLFLHYRAIAKSVKLPIFIYNIPGRCAVDMSVETMGRLAQIKNIVGVKDATGDLTRPGLQRLACGPDFCQLDGDDGTALAFNATGGVGCISVTGNIAPKLVAKMQAASLEGDGKAALKLQDRLMPLHKALFAETSPGPVKYAASLLGLCSDEVRLPLGPISAQTKERVKAALKGAGLLS